MSARERRRKQSFFRRHMAPRKPKVIVTRRLPDSVETRMRELFDAELNVSDEPMSRKALIEAMGRCDVLASTITDRIDAGLIEKAGERLKLIANFGAGVDLKYESRKGERSWL